MSQRALGRQFRITELEDSSRRVLQAHVGKREVGHLAYTGPDADGDVDIDWIESHKPGAATALVNHLAGRHPQARMTTAWFSDDGESFAEKWNQRNPQRPIAGYSGWRPGLDDHEEF